MFTLELHLVVKHRCYACVAEHQKGELTLTWLADSCVLLLCRLWMWLVWGPSARQCCARRLALCLQPSATSTRSRSPSCKVTRLQWMQTKMRKMRIVFLSQHQFTLRPLAWVYPGTPHVIMALRLLPTWLTSESVSLLSSVPSPDTSSSTCSLTPATGWCFLIATLEGYKLLHASLHIFELHTFQLSTRASSFLFFKCWISILMSHRKC